MTHIMLDLETWGRTPGSDIRSIGAVVFDPVAGIVSLPCTTCKGGTARGNVNDGGDCSDCLNTRMQSGYGNTFYVATDNPIICLPAWTPPQGGSEIKPWKFTYKLTRDPETVKWWSEQSEEAQTAFADPVDLYQACMSFAVWLEQNVSENPHPRYPDEISASVRIWANDPHFDVSILSAVFRAVQLPEPWHYRSPRSMKTITEAAGMTSEDFKAFDYGTAHNALDDAISQAMIVCEAYKRLGLQK